MREKEKKYLSEIKAEASGYLTSINSIFSSNFRQEQSFYAANPAYTQNLLYLMSRCGTADFVSFFADILKGETDPYLLSAAIIYSGDEGFDPDGAVLNAYEYLIQNRLSACDRKILGNICDSTYKLCRFMGRPAFNKQGKAILSRLMFPQFDKETRNYARKTLEKMIQLEK